MSLLEDVLAGLTPDPATAAAAPTDTTGFGIDLDCSDDLREDMALATGARMLAQAIYRRLTTPRGAVLDAPDYGLDVRAFLSRGMTAAELAAIPGQIRSEVTKDERIEDADVHARMTAPDTLELTIRCSTAAGPFELVISVTAAAAILVEVR